MGRSILKPRSPKVNRERCATLLERNGLTDKAVTFYTGRSALVGVPRHDSEHMIENFLYEEPLPREDPWHIVVEIPHPMASRSNKVLLLEADGYTNTMIKLAKDGFTGASVSVLTLKKYTTTIDQMTAETGR